MAREEHPNDWLRLLAQRAKHFTLTYPWLTSLVVVCLVSASGGAFWAWGRYYGYWEPYCLALTTQDVKPIVGEVSHGTWAPANGPEWQEESYWVCYVYGENRAAVSVEVTRQADRNMTKKTGMTVLESRAAIPGAVSEQVPGINPGSNATVVHWTGNGNAGAGWFEGDSAVVIDTPWLKDDSAAHDLAPHLAQIVKKRAPTLLTRTGYTPTPPPSPPDTTPSPQ
ncbi:hypothetical protein MANAM107_14460 [Actinomyces capricornis]|uniref:Uncharacterized protein n=1 Tax=Actinomyces capricornis TaxID=2755559 RepID=A0ABN6K5Y8_9ACTO|nr:hypothetical protein MANAM107_14460 [Actinomyces capricornis]